MAKVTNNIVLNGSLLLFWPLNRATGRVIYAKVSKWTIMSHNGTIDTP